MNTTKDEQIIKKLIKNKKEKKGRAIGMKIAAVKLVFGLYRLIRGNIKKISFTVTAVIFFLVSSSFSFPALMDNGEARVEKSVDVDLINYNVTYADLYQPEETDELLEDADVIDGYDDTNLNTNDVIDRYSLDEILTEAQMEGNDISNQTGEKEAAAEGLEYSYEEPEKGITQAENAGEAVNSEAVFDKDDWKLVLINKQHQIPEDYTFELGAIKGSMKCDARIIQELMEMMQAAKDEGVNLEICSPYRDLNRQEVLFNRKINLYMKKGMNYTEAYRTTSQTVTVPGASEHQIGLALDIVSDTYAYLDEGFGETEAGVWLVENSYKYGFILRYPKGKEYITGIEYEPWHFRYVGKEAAAVITEQGITLEEFIESL